MVDSTHYIFIKSKIGAGYKNFLITTHFFLERPLFQYVYPFYCKNIFESGFPSNISPLVFTVIKVIYVPSTFMGPCVFLYMLHTEYHNTHSTSKVRTFCLAHTPLKDRLRVQFWS